tara:strand:- start:170 stop:541 length:372 start_codon:yes stop_codon:yes gene_type:complete
MSKKQPNDGKDWTDEEVQYVVKNYFKKGILHLCQHLGRRQSRIEAKIASLRAEGYFLNHVDTKEAVDYLESMQEFHTDLITHLIDIFEKDKKMLEQQITNIKAVRDVQEMFFKFPKEVLKDEH